MFASSLVSTQTYSNCNPLTSGSCPPDTALGKSVNIDFTSGQSDSFTAQGNPTYDSDGATFAVAKSGDAPLLASKWYIMFGHVEFVVKAAAGVGIVSSAILQSDDLDEIDFEWLGYDDQNVQTNFFGKGLTASYNRGAQSPTPENHDGFSTYAIDWTANQVTWSINGKTVRTLTPASTNGYPYPQTPMMIKVGAWSGGDPSNEPGTIQWATGQASGVTTNYASGPYKMQVKSISVTDYSTGSQYKYTGTDGTWESITAVGGTVNTSGNGKGAAVDSSVKPSSSGTTEGPMPFQGTHSSKDPDPAQPNAGGWTPTTMQTAASSTVTTYPGLPAGWTVTSSGKVVPPSAAPITSPPASPSLSPADSRQDLHAVIGPEIHTSFNEQGFPVVVTVAPGAANAPKHYDDKGFLITRSTLSQRASPSSVVENTASKPVITAQAAESSTPPKVSKVSASSQAASKLEGFGLLLGAAYCILSGMILL
ncbi:hypothetical protein MMC21_001159 [Puttea exsequens]|nr:hypothetical protein [Puttea exsequens]